MVDEALWKDLKALCAAVARAGGKFPGGVGIAPSLKNGRLKTNEKLC